MIGNESGRRRNREKDVHVSLYDVLFHESVSSGARLTRAEADAFPGAGHQNVRLFFCAGGGETNGKDDGNESYKDGEGPMFRRLRMKR